jgi:hypothetical protein
LSTPHNLEPPLPTQVVLALIALALSQLLLWLSYLQFKYTVAPRCL